MESQASQPGSPFLSRFSFIAMQEKFPRISVANCGKLLFLAASAYDQAGDEYCGQMNKPNQMAIVIFMSYHPQFVYTFDEVRLKDHV